MDFLLPALSIAVVYSFLSLRVLRQYERGVSFFLGKFWGTKGPGLIFLPAGFASQKRVSLRIVALDIPPQDVITRDNVSVKVNAVLYMRVSNPSRAVLEIEDYHYATSQLAQTTLRSVLGEVELDELLSDREKINAVLKKIIDERTEAWGIEVSAVEVKDVDLPDQMKRAMARFMVSGRSTSFTSTAFTSMPQASVRSSMMRLRTALIFSRSLSSSSSSTSPSTERSVVCASWLVA